MFQVVKRLKLLKKSLMKLDIHHFQNIVAEAQADRLSLLEARKKLQSDPLNITY